MIEAAVFFAGTAAALYVRYLLRDVETEDFVLYTSKWYAAVEQDGFRASAAAVSNYTPPYLYLLAVIAKLFPNVPPVEAVKIPSVVADFVCAAFVYLIVRLRYPTGPQPVFAWLAVLLAPTVVVNGSLWGQADSLYCAMLTACVYALLVRRPVFAVLAFGVAVTLKLQSIFLAPLMAALWMRRLLPMWSPLLVPCVYVVGMLPAALMGRPFLELATIYLSQSVTYHRLSLNAPTLYAVIAPERLWGRAIPPPSHYDEIVVAGSVFAAGCCAYFVWRVYRSKADLDRALLLRLSLLCLVLVPFMLPKMHDRYFFAADVLSIAYAFWFPRHYYVPLCLGLASYLAYQPYLKGYDVLPTGVLALIVGLALFALIRSARVDLDGQSSRDSSSQRNSVESSRNR